jgi:hypothetical protein
LVRIHSFPWLASTEYCRSSLRGEISVSGAVGSAAETKRTSLVALSPVEMKIRLSVLRLGDADGEAELLFSS